MGYDLARRAYSWSPAVTDGQLKVLIAMAMNTADNVAPAVYWAGHSKIAAWLAGYPDPDVHYLATDAERQVIKRALRGLVQAGAVEVALEAGGRRKPEYVLVVDSPCLAVERLADSVDNPVYDDRSDEWSGSQKVTPLGGQKVTRRGVRK